jgi:hypothetical protein
MRAGSAETFGSIAKTASRCTAPIRAHDRTFAHARRIASHTENAFRAEYQYVRPHVPHADARVLLACASGLRFRVVDERQRFVGTVARDQLLAVLMAAAEARGAPSGAMGYSNYSPKWTTSMT